MRILIAEDETNLNKLIKKVLEKEGMVVDNAFDGKEALLFFETTGYDAAILDIMMPGIDGLEVVKRIRNKGISTPVIFLTAKDSVEDRVCGLDTGADDYLIKPFAFEELLARLRSVTRKYSTNRSTELKVSDLVVNTLSHEVTRNGNTIKLSAKEYNLLVFFMKHPGQVLSREQIEENLYDFEYDGISNVIDVYISYLRKKIDTGYEKKLIHTVRGVGFKLQGD